MASHPDDSSDPSLPSDGTSFTGIQDPGNALTTLQMLMSAQAGLTGSNANLSAQFIPFVEVVTPQTASSQSELSLSDDALFKSYASQLQGLSLPLSSTLVMTSQEMSLPTSSSSLMPTSPSPHLTTLTPSQIMLGSSSQLLTMPSSSQVSVATSNLTTASSNLTETSTSDLVTLTAPHLATMMSQQPSGDFTQHQLAIPTELALAPPPVGGAEHPGELTSAQLAAPLESLVMGTNNLLEEAAREIQASEADREVQERMVTEDGVDETEGDFSVALYDAVNDDDGGMKTDAASSALDANGDYKEEITNEWSQMFKEQITPYFGYVDSLDEAEKLLKVYEICTDSKFLGVQRCDLNNFEVKASKARPFRYTSLIICGEKLPFDGVPYYHGGKGMYYCHLGSKRKDPPGRDSRKRRKKHTQSKKVGCTARVAFRVVARFPEYRLKENTEYNRLITSQTLMKALAVRDKQEGKDVVVEWRVYVMLPKAADHSNHEIIPTLRLREEPLDRRVIGRICQLVRLGLHDTATIQKQVTHFAEHVLALEGMEWKDNGRNVCSTRQVWWYRKQILILMGSNKFQDSKFADMVREVEELSRKHNYTGYNQAQEDPNGRDGGSSSGGSSKWKKRTDKKQRKNYEKQLKDMQVACFAELERVTKSIQSCRQVEVLARLLHCIKSGREEFEKELNILETYEIVPLDQIQVNQDQIQIEEVSHLSPNAVQNTAKHKIFLQFHE